MLKAPHFIGNSPRHLDTLAEWVKGRNEEPLEPELPIVDPHHHAWDNEHGRYLLNELRTDFESGHNIVATVFVQGKAMYRTSGPDHLRSVGEVEFADELAELSAASENSKIRICDGIVGFADLTLGDKVHEVLTALISAAPCRFKGVRHGATWDDGAASFNKSFGPRHLLSDKSFRAGFAALQPLGLSFDAWMFYHQLSDLIELADAFPDTNIILDHAGGLLGIDPNVNRDEVFQTWRSSMQMLAKRSNVTVKIGGLGMLYFGNSFHLQDVPPSSAELAEVWKPYVETCIETFGAGRCMFESNFPVDKQSCGYGVLWNAFKLITKYYSPAEKAALYHETASRAYRLGAR
jgi:predicted TIM-barrel fold metal-dependent hydrolase